MRNIHMQTDVLILELRLQAVGGSLEQFAQVDRASLKQTLACFDARQLLKIVHEPLQPCDLTLDTQKGGGFSCQDTVHQSFHQALDATEGCPQLVRQVTD